MKALMAAKNYLKHIPQTPISDRIQHPSFDSRGHHQLLLSMINQSKQKYELAFLFKTSSSVVYSCRHTSLKISQRSHSLASLLHHFFACSIGTSGNFSVFYISPRIFILLFQDSPGRVPRRVLQGPYIGDQGTCAGCNCFLLTGVANSLSTLLPHS